MSRNSCGCSQVVPMWPVHGSPHAWTLEPCRNHARWNGLGDINRLCRYLGYDVSKRRARWAAIVILAGETACRPELSLRGAKRRGNHGDKRSMDGDCRVASLLAMTFGGGPQSLHSQNENCCPLESWQIAP